ncbi:MAG: MgtC/SapB family protein, partial [Fusobacterium sp.]|nr:MgtC/SapB family protein [Fusobacterium sp.]
MRLIIEEFFQDRFISELSFPIVCFRIFLAVLFGGIVGFEREKNNRPAGFRTHILVCFGAAVVSMIEDQLRINLLMQYGSTGLNLALGRLGAQVISGIGFLGAGSIMKDKGETIGGM